MVGLGCGARSYSQCLHYATEYAVSPGAVRSLIRDFSARSEEEFRFAAHGYVLDGEDQRRRHLLQSLLQTEGVCLRKYRERFDADLLDDLPELHLLPKIGLAEMASGRLRLTERGLERSDAIGPWLYSSKAQERMESYEWR
jgi:oxygen-independent coproporphyrinogen-3 oxidase